VTGRGFGSPAQFRPECSGHTPPETPPGQRRGLTVEKTIMTKTTTDPEVHATEMTAEEVRIAERVRICTEQCAAAYPIGSLWTHPVLGCVTVTAHRAAHNGRAYQVSVSPAITDDNGRVWSCYSPGADLTRP
jgi:hypothetical protein